MGEIQFGLVVFGAFDDGIDDVSLAAPRATCFADEIPDFLRALAGDAAGDDGRAAGRQFVEHADVEVAIEGERQGAGNGRRGHDQHVGLGLVGLLHQFEALQDAEAVLLIDDDEAEAIELDFFFDERVGADDELRFAAVDEAAVERACGLRRASR